MTFVANWKSCWKWFSMHALALAGILPSTWCSLPDEWRAIVPAKYMAMATVITVMIGMYGRLIDQSKDKP